MRAAARESTPLNSNWADEAVTHLQEKMLALDLVEGKIAWRSNAASGEFAGASGKRLAEELLRLHEAHGSALAGDRGEPRRLEHGAFDAWFAPDSADPPRYAFVRLEDATQLREALSRQLADREQLLSTSREIAVGEITATLAHELNQPLGSIVNLLRGLDARAASGRLSQDVLSSALEKAIGQALYASQVIARIRSFAAQREPKVGAVRLGQLVRNTLALLDWEIRRDGVATDLAVPDDLPSVLGDPVMVQQVLVNLARNAIEAMRAVSPNARRLTIAGRVEPSAERIELIVSDTGPGLQAAAPRPFAASGRAGSMGIGLSICRSIVELHRGRIWACDNAHGGAEFHVLLPAAAPDPSSE